eukprot:g16725.t1
MSPDLREDIHEELGVALVACSLKGWRKSQEDTSAIVINLGGQKDMLGVGVFDGHSGQDASKYVAANLWNAVTATAEWAAKDIDGALKAAFLAVDATMQREKVRHGTTAVVAVVTPGSLYVANCGDSRAVLCKEGVATAMSTDHKPCVITEMSRVLRCGGSVIPGEFGGVSRVTYPGCSVAMATSRSLGDFHFKRNYNSSPAEQVVSPAPEVVCVPRGPGDEFLILGTDGVWDVLTNQEVSDMMRASNRARRPAAEIPPAVPPATLWENSSAKASALATATAATNMGDRDGAGEGGKSTSRELGLGDAVQEEAGRGRSQNGETPSLLSSGRRINGFAAPAAAPSTPFNPPITPHHTARPAAPFAVPSSGAAAAAGGDDADSYESSDCGSSDAGSSDAAAETSHVGMDIDGDGKGGSGRQKRPAFVRLFTPTLMRLVTPTPPNPATRAPQRAAPGTAAAATAVAEAATATAAADGAGRVAEGERARSGGGGSPPGSLGPDEGEGGGGGDGDGDGDDDGGVLNGRSGAVADAAAAAPDTAAARVAAGGVTPRVRTPGGSGGGGLTPSARTPGGSGGSGGGVGGAVGATPNRLTPAWARTPASSRTSGGAGAGGAPASTCTSVSHTPSRQTSNSRAATPTSRVNSYRRSSGSGLNLGLFKSSGSLSVSMSGRGDRSAVGAVQGVLDKALLKGSQDNMTIIAIDLRGLLEASPPESASSTNL